VPRRKRKDAVVVSFSIPREVADVLAGIDNRSEVVSEILLDNIDRIGDVTLEESHNISVKSIERLAYVAILRAIAKLYHDIQSGKITLEGIEDEGGSES